MNFISKKQIIIIAKALVKLLYIYLLIESTLKFSTIKKSEFNVPFKDNWIEVTTDQKLK